MKKTTIKEIAQYAEVSPTLVSFYLNGRQPNKIAETTKKKIAEAIDVLNYRPSVVARTLRNGKSKTIGLVTGRICGIYASFHAQALLHEVLKYGYQLLISVTRYDPEEEQRCLENLLDRQADGILYHLYLTPDLEKLPILRNFPILQHTSINPAFNSLTSEIGGPIKQAMEQYKGGTVAGLFEDFSRLNLWYATVTDCAKEMGMDCRCYRDSTSGPSDALFQALCDSGVDAIISGSSVRIAQFIRFCEARGIRKFPHLIYSYTLPSDYISHPAIAGAIVNSFKPQVEQGVKFLIDMIGKKTEKPQHRTIPSVLMNREELSAHYRKQIADPYYDAVVNEWGLKRLWEK